MPRAKKIIVATVDLSQNSLNGDVTVTALIDIKAPLKTRASKRNLSSVIDNDDNDVIVVDAADDVKLKMKKVRKGKSKDDDEIITPVVPVVPVVTVPAVVTKKVTKKAAVIKVDPVPTSTNSTTTVTVTVSGSDFKVIRPVDEHCHLNGTATVVDEYDVMLNQVDIVQNKNKFYRIQLLQTSSSYHVWTRWGRVGEIGVNSLLGPFSSVGEADKTFASKFRDKTGNAWNARDQFQSKKGKYDLIQRKIEHNVPNTVSKVVATQQKTAIPKSITQQMVIPPSRLPVATQDLIRTILDKEMFRITMQSMNLDIARMPLGELSDLQISKGFNVLERIKNTLMSSVNSRTSIQDLTSEFYTVIPHSFSRNHRPDLIDSLDLLNSKIEMLSTLNDIVIGNEITKVSENELTQLTENPIDTKYNELHSDLELLNSSNPVYHTIMKYITNTKDYHNITLDNVWSVRRDNEDKSFNKFNSLDNHKLLWHGTNSAVVAAILKTGLRIMPTVNGGRVGRGIYLANELSKSASYVRTTRDPHGKTVGILFLVEAALGKSHVIYR